MQSIYIYIFFFLIFIIKKKYIYFLKIWQDRLHSAEEGGCSERGQKSERGNGVQTGG